jgi:hypothetical protein
MTTRLTRSEAAAYLTERGRTIAPQTLANKQVQGTGPKYTSEGWRTGYYLVSDLDAWLERERK